MASQQRRNQKRKRKKREYSKVIVGWTFIVITAFFIFAFYEMHRLNDLTQLEFVTDVIKFLCVASVGGYFWKAKAENEVKLELEYQREASKLKKQYGEDFVTETLEFDKFSEY